jgi:hypothetical protein
MKKYFYLLIAVCFLFTSCKKEENRKEENKSENEGNFLCSTPLFVFTVLVKKEAPDYALFFKDSDQIDKDSIYYFRKINGKNVKYGQPEVDIFNNRVLRILTPQPFDLFTGKKETVYLKNRTKSYKIDVLGTYKLEKIIEKGKEHNCGYSFDVQEVYINDVKYEKKEEDKRLAPSYYVVLE